MQNGHVKLPHSSEEAIMAGYPMAAPGSLHTNSRHFGFASRLTYGHASPRQDIAAFSRCIVEGRIEELYMYAIGEKFLLLIGSGGVISLLYTGYRRRRHHAAC